jgi:hypothetical protein
MYCVKFWVRQNVIILDCGFGWSGSWLFGVSRVHSASHSSSLIAI